jgi:hypothetical protein
LSIAVRHFLERGGAANAALEPAPLSVIDKPIRSITAAISSLLHLAVDFPQHLQQSPECRCNALDHFAHFSENVSSRKTLGVRRTVSGCLRRI